MKLDIKKLQEQLKIYIEKGEKIISEHLFNDLYISGKEYEEWLATTRGYLTKQFGNISEVQQYHLLSKSEEHETIDEYYKLSGILNALYKNPEYFIDDRKTQVSRNMIFISHRSADKQIADDLLNFMVMCGVPREQIFCSSLPGNDIKEKISAEVKNTIKQSKVNIVILSKAYYESAYCLNEAGIIWFEDVKCIVIALPEIDESKMYGFLNSEYKIRRLNDTNDISYIYDTLISELSLDKKEVAIVSGETNKLISKYNNIINKNEAEDNRLIASNNKASNILSDISTDDERVVLFFVLEKNKRKISENEVKNWLIENEIDDVNVSNAFDLISNIGEGKYNDECLEIDINYFRKLMFESNHIHRTLNQFVLDKKSLRCDICKNMWRKNKFSDKDKLFIVYIIEHNRKTLGDRWKSEGEITAIEEWEESYDLENVLSSNYNNCLDKFINNKLVYESEWTSHGNPREYTLYSSLEAFLNSENFPYSDELNKIKQKYQKELPF